MEHIEQYLGTNHTILNNVDVKHSLRCCFRAHNLHVGVTVLRTVSAISFFSSREFLFLNLGG